MYNYSLQNFTLIAVVNCAQLTTERKTERTDNSEEEKKTYAQQLTAPTQKAGFRLLMNIEK